MGLGFADKIVFAYLILAAFLLGVCSLDFYINSGVLTDGTSVAASIFFTCLYGIFIFLAKGLAMCIHYIMKTDKLEKSIQNREIGFGGIFLLSFLTRIFVYFEPEAKGDKLMFIYPTPFLLCFLSIGFLSYFLFSTQSATRSLWNSSDYKTEILVIILLNIGALVFSVLIVSAFEYSSRHMSIIVMCHFIFFPFCVISSVEIYTCGAERKKIMEARKQAKLEKKQMEKQWAPRIQIDLYPNMENKSNLDNKLTAPVGIQKNHSFFHC